MGPTARGGRSQKAGLPCAGSSRVSPNTFSTGGLRARSAFTVRSASVCRGDLRSFSGTGGCGPRRGRAPAIGPASWCDAHQPVEGLFVFWARIGGRGSRRGSAIVTHDANRKPCGRVQNLRPFGVGGRGRRPLESADPMGPACGWLRKGENLLKVELWRV